MNALFCVVIGGSLIWFERGVCTIQVTGCKDHRQNDIECAEWNVKPYGTTPSLLRLFVHCVSKKMGHAHCGA